MEFRGLLTDRLRRAAGVCEMRHCDRRARRVSVTVRDRIGRGLNADRRAKNAYR